MTSKKNLKDFFTEEELYLAKKANPVVFNKIRSIIQVIPHEFLCASLAGNILAESDFDEETAYATAQRLVDITDFLIKNGLV